jgi:hypothetical protein
VHIFDAWTPGNIPASAPASMLYLDGGGAASEAEQATAAARGPLLLNSVLANPAAQVQDYEPGNAPIDRVATACVLRLGQGLWTTVYCDGADIGTVVAGLAAKSLHLAPASSWPAPGVYLHAADPTGTDHIEVGWAPVQPVAVQWLWLPGYDVSSGYGTYPAVGGPTPPPEPLPSEDDMTPTVYVNYDPSSNSYGAAFVTTGIGATEPVASEDDLNIFTQAGWNIVRVPGVAVWTLFAHYFRLGAY